MKAKQMTDKKTPNIIVFSFACHTAFLKFVFEEFVELSISMTVFTIKVSNFDRVYFAKMHLFVNLNLGQFEQHLRFHGI